MVPFRQLFGEIGNVLFQHLVTLLPTFLRVFPLSRMFIVFISSSLKDSPSAPLITIILSLSLSVVTKNQWAVVLVEQLLPTPEIFGKLYQLYFIWKDEDKEKNIPGTANSNKHNIIIKNTFVVICDVAKQYFLVF